MDTRIGYPTEHLASSNSIENLTSPMYATGIGLVLKGFEALERNKAGIQEDTQENKEGQGKTDTRKVPFFERLKTMTKGMFEEEED